MEQLREMEREVRQAKKIQQKPVMITVKAVTEVKILSLFLRNKIEVYASNVKRNLFLKVYE